MSQLLSNVTVIETKYNRRRKYRTTKLDDCPVVFSFFPNFYKFSFSKESLQNQCNGNFTVGDEILYSFVTVNTTDLPGWVVSRMCSQCTFDI